MNTTQAADQFERFARSTDEVAGGFGSGFFGIHANTNGTDARNFKLALPLPRATAPGSACERHRINNCHSGTTGKRRFNSRFAQ
jgi:hypothetical protein